MRRIHFVLLLTSSTCRGWVTLQPPTSNAIGNAALSPLVFSPDHLDFGSVSVSSASPKQTLTLTNNGATATSLSLSLASGSVYVIADNTCAEAALSPNASCTASLLFVPQNVGSVTDTLIATDAASGHTQSAVLSGIGSNAGATATIAIAPVAAVFEPTAIGRQSAPSTLTISNSGGGDASNLALSIGSAEFLLASNTCGSTLAAGANCAVAVSFTADKVGSISDALTVTFDDASATQQSQTASLSGSGQNGAAMLTFAPAAGTFQNIATGDSSSPQTFTVSNNGNASASKVFIALGNATQASSEFTISNSSCGASSSNAVSIAKNASCSFNVVFHPSTAGAKSDTVTLTYDDPSASGQTLTASLSGTVASANPQAVLGFTPASMSFATAVTVGASASQTVTLKNSGTAQAIDVFVALTTGASFSLPSANNNCGSTGAEVSLGINASCTFKITFAPATAGSLADTVTVTFSDTNAAKQTQPASVQGTGQQPSASIAFVPTSFTFSPTVVGGSSAAKTFTVNNLGTGAASNFAVTSSDQNQFAISASTCGSTLAAKTGSCTFSVTFEPSASGTQSAKLTASFDDASASGQTQIAAISGNGQANTPSLAFSPTSYNFNSVVVGSPSSAEPFTLSNSGGAAASSLTLSFATGAEFALSASTCGSSLAANASCTFNVTFTPNATGAQTDTLIATYGSASTKTAALQGSGAAAGATTAYGMTIPAAHPRLYWTTDRLAQLKTWWKTNAFVPNGDSDPYDMLMAYEATGTSSYCDLAVSVSNSLVGDIADCSTSDNDGCDQYRWNGEIYILTYDWCYNAMSSSQRTTMMNNLNTWVAANNAQGWGGVGMSQSNYYWGDMRNSLEFGISSYGENQTNADAFIKNAIQTRYQDDFEPASIANGEGAGGLFLEGNEYGPYDPYYAGLVAFPACESLGRSVWSETPAWMGAVYNRLYLTPGQASPSRGWDVFPFSDDQNWENGSPGATFYVGDFMLRAANEWPSLAVGQYARQWVNMVHPDNSNIVLAADAGGSGTAFSALPLDYYDAGPRYLLGRNAWSSGATIYFFQMGDVYTSGHSHNDWGTFQINRGGVWLTRETVGYGGSVADYGGSGNTDVFNGIAHNVPLIDGEAGINDQQGNYDASPLVSRLESNAAGYVYADVDLSGVYRNDNSDSGHPERENTAAEHVEREYVFIRDIEAFVIFDRLQSDTAARSKTFTYHCETQPVAIDAHHTRCTNGAEQLYVTTLLPATPSSVNFVNEDDTADDDVQYRVEINDTPGTTTSYTLHVLQAMDKTATPLSPSVVDSNPGSVTAGFFTVTIDANHSLVLDKGLSSSGGSITINGTSTNFRADVQSMSFSSSGPVWNP